MKKWDVEIGDEFGAEFDALAEDVQDEILAHTRLLQEYGPQLGRLTCGYVQRVAPRKHEGTALSRRR